MAVLHRSRKKEKIGECGILGRSVFGGNVNQFFCSKDATCSCVVPYRTNLAFDEIPLRARSIGLIRHDFKNSQKKDILKIRSSVFFCYMATMSNIFFLPILIKFMREEDLGVGFSDLSLFY